MSLSIVRVGYLGVVAAILAATLALTDIAVAQREGPFSGLAGTWQGGGTIKIGNGANERIRCRANYQTASGGAAVTLSLRCASDSYKFELQGNVRYQGGEVLGDWNETTRGAAGRVVGSVKGNQINVRVEGQTFSALLSVATRGNSQSINIQAPVGSEMSAANITLNRRG